MIGVLSVDPDGTARPPRALFSRFATRGATWGRLVPRGELADQIDPQGRIIGVSAGTGPSGKEQYVDRAVGTYTWGTGAFLLAACAWAEGDLR